MISSSLSYHREHDATAQTSGRQHELDWLRVLIILGLIPFHVIGLFAVAIDAYMQGGVSSPLISLFSDFFGLWPMSLLFLVAGASTWFALGRRSPRQYSRERLLRLFVPFLFATLVIIPIQVYAVVSAYPQLIQLNVIPDSGLQGGESFLQFYPVYLKGYSYFLTHFSSLGEFVFWGHIWFVPRLLLYALATLPLLLWLRRKPGEQLIQRIAQLFAPPGAIMLLGLSFALPRVLAAACYRLAFALTPGANWDIFNLWAQFGVFLVCFVLGYLFYASPSLLHAVRRDGPVALALGLVSFALLQTPLGHIASVTEISLGGITTTALRAESEWLLVVGVLSLGLQFLTITNHVLEYLNEAAYPLYVLHMPVLILVGLSIIQSGMPKIIALPVIIVATLALTLGLYECVIKRIAVLRLLFGLKPAHTRLTQATEKQL